MVQIEFHDDGRVIKGILLGKYQRPHDEVYSYEKKFLWKTKTIYAHRTLNTPLYIVFIPWKHQLKELREVDEKYIINPQSFNADETCITKDKFISETYDGYIYPSSLEVKDFVGYKFIYDNNSFIANLCLHEFEDCLTILYKNMPEVLDIELGNIEVSRQINVHKMKLNSTPFEMIKSGEKTIELRLYDEKRQRIKVGDKIVFTDNTTGETLNTTVTKLHRFNTFNELYKSLPLLKCGYTTENIDKATPTDMGQYYSVEEQEKYGVVGIELCRPKAITDESVVCLTRK